MIKFFRRIRKKLLNEGNLKRYLIYAIGEILLVMVGILLALQVNNWNQAKKNKAIERNTLYSILENLEEDTKTLQYAIDRYHRSLKNIKRLYDGIPIPYDSLGLVTTMANGNRKFIPITSAFDRSASNGTFDLIKDDDLAQAIQRLYKFHYMTANTSYSMMYGYHTKMRDLHDKYSTFTMSDVKRDPSFYGYALLPWNIENLKNSLADPEMQKIYIQFNVNVSIILSTYDTMISKNNEIKQSIKSYLESQ